MSRPRLLDLFCGAGGAATGYHLAGFEVLGVDHAAQPRYPFEFVKADALMFLRCLLERCPEDNGGASIEDFAAIHASPPCQAYSACSHLPNCRRDHPDLVGATRAGLEAAGLPWVIENVPGAPLRRASVMLCGLMFDLGVFRHRWFESSVLLMVPPHPSHRGKRIGVGGMCCVAGNGGQGVGWSCNGTRRLVPKDHRTANAWRKAMGIDWMTQRELAQAIPPAYTEFLGRQLRLATEVAEAKT